MKEDYQLQLEEIIDRNLENPIGSQQLATYLISYAKYLEKPANSILTQKGSMAQSIFFIIWGAARVYKPYKDKKITQYFAFENEALFLYDSYYYNKQSEVEIELIEDSRLFVIDIKHLATVPLEINKLNQKWIDKMTDEYVIFLESRCLELQTLSAKERYLNLFQTEPNVIKRASLESIATYLGISQETLSRVRSTI